MDREHVKGAADKAKGAIKDTAGKLWTTKIARRKASLIKRKVPHITSQAMLKTLFEKPPSSTHNPNFEKSRLRAALFVFVKLCEISRRGMLLPV